MTPESQIKATICSWLERQRWRCKFWVTQSVGIRGRTNNSRWSCKGVADINGIWVGRPLFIEVKVPGKKPTPEQQEFLEDARKHGAIAFVAHSLDEVLNELLKEEYIRLSPIEKLARSQLLAKPSQSKP